MKFIYLLLLPLMFVSCNKKSSTDVPVGPKDPTTADKFSVLLSSTGEEHVVIREHAYIGGYSVFQNKVTGEFVAYNLKKFDVATMTTLDAYLAAATGPNDRVGNLYQNHTSINDGYWGDKYVTNTGTTTTYDESCRCNITTTWTEKVYVGQEWVDRWSDQTYYEGGGFRFTNTGSFPKDFESMAAMGEAAALRVLSNNFKLSLNLSEDRAQELGKLYYRWQKLESKRELTDSEKSLFATEALGVSYRDAELAVAKKILGDESAYTELLEKAADVNRTTPEKIGLFIEEMAL